MGDILDVLMDGIAVGDLKPSTLRVGRAEVLGDGRLAVWTSPSEAGRTARGLLEVDCLDVDVVKLVSGPTVVRLRP